jgi:tetratricopeptide (TPR) repeat protein
LSKTDILKLFFASRDLNKTDYMSSLPSNYNEWLTKLMAEANESVIEALHQLPETPPHPNALHAIEIIWQLHPEVEIQELAYSILRQYCRSDELENRQQQFEIFRSVSEVLPWMQEDSTDIQIHNFERFHPIKELIEPLIASSAYYSDRYLDLARKLYMLFKLEDAAESCFKGLLTHAPDNNEALYALGRIEEKRDHFDRAIELYEKSIEVNPDNIYAQLQLGSLKANVKEDYEAAIHHYNKVIEIDPYAAEPYVRVAEAYYQMEEYPRAKQFIEIALGVNEFQEEALNLLGTYYWKVENDYDKAIETYQKGLDHQLHGDSAILLASLGDLHAQYMQDMDKAKLYYEKSLKVNPAQKSVLKEYIPILIQHFQDFGAVSECYEIFLAQKPLDIDILTAYAQFLADYLHDYETAFEQLKKIMELDEESPDSQKLYNRIKDYVGEEEDEEDEDWEEEYDDDDDDDDDDFTGGGAAGDS